jgi:hypothetical protein
MKGLKTILWIIVGLLAAFLLLAVWYQHKYAMETIIPYSVNAPDLESKLLIATQGSAFKDTLTKGIVNHYRSVPVFIKVIDIAALESIEPQNFSAIVVIHTWENWKPPLEVKTFLERTKNEAHKIVVFTTSGKGTYKMENVDALTGESLLANAPKDVAVILKKLDAILQIP